MSLTYRVTIQSPSDMPLWSPGPMQETEPLFPPNCVLTPCLWGNGASNGGPA